MSDPVRSSLARLAERAPAPAESGRTTFRLPRRAADALGWLTSQLRSTQKDVLAGLPDVVEDIQGTELWNRLGDLLEAPTPQTPTAPPAAAYTSSLERPLAALVPVAEEPAPLADAEFLATPGRQSSLEAAPADTRERSTYVLPRDALERITRLSESLGIARDEVVARALIALRASVELRQAGRPEVIRSLRERIAGLEHAVGAAAEESVALPPHDPIRVNLERAYEGLVQARAALDAEPAGRAPPRGQ